MKMRIDLQYELEKILGSRNVYFQPPEYIKLKYPCIIYSLANFSNRNANDKKYIKYKKYTITLVIQDYDDIIVDDLVNTEPFNNYDLVDFFGAYLTNIVSIINVLHNSITISAS